MAQISYGSITIVDVTDIGQFSVYPRANASKTQIYNPDADSYMPDWETNNVIISPVTYYAGMQEILQKFLKMFQQMQQVD